MNYLLLVASILSLVTAAIKGVLGETAIFQQASETTLPSFRLPEILRFLTLPTPTENTGIHWAYLRATWHFVTIDFIFSAVVFAAAALTPSATLHVLVRITAVRYFSYSIAWFLIVALRHRSVLRAPQWALVLAIAVCAWLG